MHNLMLGSFISERGIQNTKFGIMINSGTQKIFFHI